MKQSRKTRRVFKFRLVFGGLVSAAVLATAATIVQATPEIPRSVIKNSPAILTAPAGKKARSLELPITANLVGARWNGSAQQIEIRSRLEEGGWSKWAALDSEPNEGPDTVSSEAQRAAHFDHAAAVPAWVGSTKLIQFRVPHNRSAKDIRIVSINTTGTATRPARVATSLRALVKKLDPRIATGGAVPNQPTIVSRASWGADESLRCCGVSYYPTLKGGVLHHTVNANNYSRSQSAALVRGIYIYHTRSNGWNDIGYNAIVDRYGKIFEGRYGGIRKNVLGAHTGGFNTGTVGVALLGTHDAAAMTTAQRSGVIKFFSWRLDIGHVRTTNTMALRSGGNDKFSEGTIVRARALSGHRDLYFTGCPGGAAYTTINGLRNAIWNHGGPKFADPSATYVTSGGKVTSITVRATGNRYMKYKLTVYRRSNSEVLGTKSLYLQNAAIKWSAANAPGGTRTPWEYKWKLEATRDGASARPYAEPLVAAPPPVQLSQLSPSTRVVSPNGDGYNDALRTVFSLNTPATLAARVDAWEGGALVHTIWNARYLGSGVHSLDYAATAGGEPLSDGEYALNLVATDPVPDRPTDTVTTHLTVDTVAAFPYPGQWISPNADTNKDTLQFSGSVVGGPYPTTVRVLKGSTVVRTLLSEPTTGDFSATFNGRADDAEVLADGHYTVRLAVNHTDRVATVYRTITVDTVPPRAGLYRKTSSEIRIWVSERSTLRAYRRENGEMTLYTKVVPAGWSSLYGMYGTNSATLTDLAVNMVAKSVT